jgi:hypothetical protein
VLFVEVFTDVTVVAAVVVVVVAAGVMAPTFE